jgi:glycosyltransferase involved in cell wall biosynthesis
MPTTSVFNLPKVSVIITCFNREECIQRAMQSVLNQTYLENEIIVVDDCSTDNSLEIIKKFKAINFNAKITLASTTKNSGQVAARNLGVELAKSEIITFLDSDDVYDPYFLEETAGFLLSPAGEPYGFAYCRIEGGRKWKLEGFNKYSAVLKQGYLSAQGTLAIRREVWNRVEEMIPRERTNDICDDDELCFKLAKVAGFKLIRKPLYRTIGQFPSSSSDPLIGAKGWEDFYFKFKTEILLHTNMIVWLKHLGRIGSVYKLVDNQSEYEAYKLRVEKEFRTLALNLQTSIFLYHVFLLWWRVDKLRFEKIRKCNSIKNRVKKRFTLVFSQ